VPGTLQNQRFPLLKLAMEDLVLHLAIQSGLILAQESEGTQTGSGYASLIMIALIVGGGYLLFIRPQRRRAREMEALRSSIVVGSEVRTVGGIYGTVLELDDETVVLDTGGGGRLRLARRAVAEKLDVSDAAEPEDDQ
jgi:preprotein translocase subunit YajC